MEKAFEWVDISEIKCEVTLLLFLQQLAVYENVRTYAYAYLYKYLYMRLHVYVSSEEGLCLEVPRRGVDSENYKIAKFAVDED